MEILLRDLGKNDLGDDVAIIWKTVFTSRKYLTRC